MDGKFMLKCTKIINKEIQINQIKMLNDINNRNSGKLSVIYFLPSPKKINDFLKVIITSSLVFKFRTAYMYIDFLAQFKCITSSNNKQACEPLS